MPLLQCDLHLVLTQPLDDLDELLESAMALFIKSAVSEEFVETVLLPFCKHLFHQLEHDLRDEKFVVVLVVLVHLCPLPSDFLDTVIVGPIELVQLLEEVVPFLCQTVNDQLDVVVLSFVLHAVSLQAINFCCYCLHSVVSHHLLLLQLLQQVKLCVEIFTNLVENG